MTKTAELNTACTLDTLLTAMVAHNPSTLPLSPDVRYTENGQALDLGDGLWGTLTGYAGGPASSPGFRVDLVDGSKSTAVFFGCTLETSTPGMMMLRMKTREGQIAEIEAISVRSEKPGERGGTVTLYQPPLLTPFDPSAFERADARWLAPAAPGALTLGEIVERYVAALERSSSEGVPFAADCWRVDNGVRTSGNPDALPLDPEAPAYRPFELGVAAQIDSGFFKRIARVRECRHVATDQARGLVLSTLLLDQTGELDIIEVPGAGPVRLPRGFRPDGLDPQVTAQFYVERCVPNFRVPLSELVVQLTRIEAGRIARIETIARGVPFGMSCGWCV